MQIVVLKNKINVNGVIIRKSKRRRTQDLAVKSKDLSTTPMIGIYGRSLLWEHPIENVSEATVHHGHRLSLRVPPEDNSIS